MLQDHSLRDTESGKEAPLDELLQQSGAKSTPMREWIFKTLEESEEALSMADLEGLLETVDKSTISRTLSLFVKSGVVHKIDDGTGVSKYALSRHDSDGEERICRTHFYCLTCGRTYCIDDQSTLRVPLPKGFEADDLRIVIKGKCPNCKS